MATRVTYPIFKAWTSAGTFAVGYKLYTYEAGTSTLLTTYQDEDESVPHTNPIILDSLGEAEIFLTEAAKFTLTDADDNVQSGWPVDDVDPVNVDASDVAYVPSGDLVSLNVQDAIDEMVVELETLSDAVDEAELSWSVITSDTVAENGHGYFVDTTSAAITVTAPPSPSIGDRFAINDVAGTFGIFACVIGRNGSDIKALEEDLTIGIAHTSIELIYSNSTYGWVIA